MGGSIAMRNRRSTPPLIQQFGNDIAGFADGIVAYPVNAVQGVADSVSGLLNAYTEIAS